MKKLIFVRTGPWWSKIPLGYWLVVTCDKPHNPALCCNSREEAAR